MTKSDYEVKYPLDAVSVEKFAELLGKPETAVRKMIINNKLPVVELTVPEATAARVGERWVVISEFNRRVLEAALLNKSELADRMAPSAKPVIRS